MCEVHDSQNRRFVDISYIWLWPCLLVCCVLRLLRYSLTENCTRSKLKSSLMISCPLEVRTLARIACLGNRHIISFLKHFLDRPVKQGYKVTTWIKFKNRTSSVRDTLNKLSSFDSIWNILKKAMRDCRQKYRRFHSFAGQPRSKCQTEFCDITFIVLKLCVTKHFVIKCFTFSF